MKKYTKLGLTLENLKLLFESSPGVSLSEWSRTLGVSRERVRQLWKMSNLAPASERKEADRDAIRAELYREMEEPDIDLRSQKVAAFRKKHEGLRISWYTWKKWLQAAPVPVRKLARISRAQEELIVKRAKTGKFSDGAISREAGVSMATVARIRRENELPLGGSPWNRYNPVPDDLILSAFKASGGNISAAARSLGVSVLPFRRVLGARGLLPGRRAKA